MDQKYIWPLIGVLLGWLLTTISSGYKERANKKRLVGNLLTKLIRVERQLNILISATENIKDIADSWETYEPIRIGVVKRHFMEPENVRSDLKSSIDGIAPIYPLLAIELEDIFQRLLKNKSAKLLSSSKNRDVYIRMLSIYEVGLDFSQKELTAIINKIALKPSLISYIKVKKINHKRKSNLKNTKNFSEKLVGDVISDIKITL